MGSLVSNAVETWKELKKIGEDDPRKIVHSFKVGVALTIVSMFYYFRPLYQGMGQAGMWAILTVVVVFEFTVGGTLSKSINRGFATLVAGALGVAAEYVADLCGKNGEPILLGVLVFLLAAVCTFARFLPSVKKKYDYGVMIFILTFTLVAVSGYRIEEILTLAHQRLATILIGGATCIVISVFVCPVWAGQDLHNLVASNIDKLAAFLQGYGEQFLGGESGKAAAAEEEEEKPFLLLQSVLNSKATEENLANFAWWEPCHGRFGFGHPWMMYLKIATLCRECAYLIQTLNASSSSHSTNPTATDIFRQIRELCRKICMESSQVLRELSTSIRTATFRSPATTETYRDELKSLIESSSFQLRDNVPLLVVAFVLIDIKNCVDKAAAAVDELSIKARFKKGEDTEKSKSIFRMFRRGTVKPFNEDAC
ncbi:hypothetical protein M569_05152 [Genlisea aurea]|uniref:Aluminum-activated malate transporter n=1 Tax=Genlisea aurea TaxID=192259 RepID=S8CQX3_9LAMI|nr:hypothetical protein M569_05152 [Genlisea aurea]